jgi:hypothetical protein
MSRNSIRAIGTAAVLVTATVAMGERKDETVRLWDRPVDAPITLSLKHKAAATRARG